MGEICGIDYAPSFGPGGLSRSEAKVWADYIQQLLDAEKRLRAEVHLAFYEGFESRNIDPDFAWDRSRAKTVAQYEEQNDG